MRFLLVDAHSAIFACPELHALHQRNAEAARDRLVGRLTAYQDSTGERVVVVFDGQGAKHSQQKLPQGVQVFYSSRKGTADQIIERLVAKYAQEHEMVVATNDRLEQQTVITFGGQPMSIEWLFDRMDAADAEVARRIRKHNRSR